MCNCVSNVNWMLRNKACIAICVVVVFVYRSSQLQGKCICPPGSACYNRMSCDLATWLHYAERCQPGTSVHKIHMNCISHVTLRHLLTPLGCVYNRSL
jgi:hypothetical protein